MPGRRISLVNNEFYHIFNRGSDKRNIFIQPRDYARLQRTFYYYQFLGPKIRFSQFTATKFKSFNPAPEKKLVEIICYCLMPNHFHFLLQQLKDNGISTFISQVANSYAKYFNTKYKRIGALLQGTFKAVRIENDDQFLHVSRYIHLNPIVSEVAQNLDDYSWSSFPEYMNSDIFCSSNEILKFFPSKEKYREFVEDQIDYGTSLESIKHHLFDEL